MEKRHPGDFTFGRILGEGSFSTVYYCEEKQSKKEYAVINLYLKNKKVKVLDKRHILREKKAKYVSIEKEVLNRMIHPFIIKLFYTFQDTNSLYFCLEFAPNGDLLGWLRKCGPFSTTITQFYTAELIMALEFLHKHHILHRDVKPEVIRLSNSIEYSLE
jgi:3-phosphoinositide dependent protein kinase-1